MATHKLALIIRNPSNETEFLLEKQTPPPKFDDEEYNSYVDSDLWDLPSTPLSSLEGESRTRVVVEGDESCLNKLDLVKFDLDLALSQDWAQHHSGDPDIEAALKRGEDPGWLWKKLWDTGSSEARAHKTAAV